MYVVYWRKAVEILVEAACTLDRQAHSALRGNVTGLTIKEDLLLAYLLKCRATVAI